MKAPAWHGMDTAPSLQFHMNSAEASHKDVVWLIGCCGGAGVPAVQSSCEADGAASTASEEEEAAAC